MELEVFEILERFENITSKNERVAYLREQSIPALKDVVRGCFDESLEFVLPVVHHHTHQIDPRVHLLLKEVAQTVRGLCAWCKVWCCTI